PVDSGHVTWFQLRVIIGLRRRQIEPVDAILRLDGSAATQGQQMGAVAAGREIKRYRVERPVPEDVNTLAGSGPLESDDLHLAAFQPLAARVLKRLRAKHLRNQPVGISGGASRPGLRVLAEADRRTFVAIQAESISEAD